MREDKEVARTAHTGENVVGNGVHPHPNLPPSRGKGGEGMGPHIREDKGRGRDLFDAASGDTGSGVHYDGIGKHVVQAAFIDSQTHH